MRRRTKPPRRRANPEAARRKTVRPKALASGTANEPGKPRQPHPPYIAARQEWLERYGDYISQARTWRVTAILALGVATLAVGGLIALANQNRVVPYVVKVDKLGAAVAVERADTAARPDAAIIKAQLARWVTAMRSVYVDAAAQRALVREAYGMINRLGASYGALNDYMRAHDPFEQGQDRNRRRRSGIGAADRRRELAARMARGGPRPGRRAGLIGAVSGDRHSQLQSADGRGRRSGSIRAGSTSMIFIGQSVFEHLGARPA